MEKKGKKTVKNTMVLITFMLVVILMSVRVYAGQKYDDDKITGFDFADIYMNGSLALGKDTGYTRQSDSQVIPSTLNWDGTTYVPLRLMSELLGAKVGWDGSILIDLDKSGAIDELADYGKRVLSKKKIVYTNEMSFQIIGGKTAYVEDRNGDIIYDLDVDLDPKQGIIITNPYMLGLNDEFTLVVVKDDEIVEQPFHVGHITMESFEWKNGQWYTVLPADPEAGFYHPMIIGFSAETNDKERDFARLNDTMIVEGSNEGVTFSNQDSYRKQINERFSGEMSVLIAGRNQLPYMVSMFPRPIQDGLLYSHALDRDTLFQSQSYLDGLSRGNLYRMDEQFLAGTEAAQKVFASLGLKVDERVGIAGFSASSDWANRLTMLHPDRIKFVVANLTATMPMTRYEGHDLPYPLGLSNIKEITGTEFDPVTYKSVPQFWFVGADDMGDGTRYDDGWGNYGDRRNEWNQEGIDYRAIFGRDSIKRRSLQMTIIEGLGFDKIEYIAYEGLEHDWGDRQLEDMDAFIQRINN